MPSPFDFNLFSAFNYIFYDYNDLPFELNPRKVIFKKFFFSFFFLQNLVNPGEARGYHK